MKFAIFLLLIIVSCTYKNTDTTSYTYYYNKENDQKKVEGQFIDGQESGEWIYFSEDSKIVQSGVYQYGLPIGEWIYHYPDLDTSLVWKEVFIDNLSFSLPNSFNQFFRNTDTSSKYYTDTLSGTLFTVKVIEKVDNEFVKNFYNLNLISFKDGCEVEFSKSDEILNQEHNYYVDEFKLQKVNDTSGLISQIMIYKKIEDKLVVLGFTSRNPKDGMNKFILQEIFLHFKLDNRRIINIYEGFDVCKGSVSAPTPG